MQGSGSLSWQWTVGFFVLAACCAVVDLKTKDHIAGTVTAEERQAVPPEVQEIIPKFFSLLYGAPLNRGALFSLGNEYGQLSNRILITLCIVAMIAISVWILWPGAKHSPVQVTILGFILGGAFGNFYDRLVYGGVRDWIWVYYERAPKDFPFNWPVFNLADCFLVCGVTFLLVHSFFFDRVKATEKSVLKTETKPSGSV